MFPRRLREEEERRRQPALGHKDDIRRAEIINVSLDVRVCECDHHKRHNNAPAMTIHRNPLLYLSFFSWGGRVLTCPSSSSFPHQAGAPPIKVG